MDTAINSKTLSDQLLDAAMNGETKKVVVLVRHGADLHATDEVGWTALHWAACEDRTETVCALLGLGSDPNVRNHEGATPLHLAAWHQHIETGAALIHGGADISIQDQYGDTPVSILDGCGYTFGAEVITEQFSLKNAGRTKALNHSRKRRGSHPSY